MKTKFLYLVLFLAGVCLGAAAVVRGVRSEWGHQQADFHEHADFAVVIDGEKVDFGKIGMMSVKPCGDTHEEDELSLSDVIHLHNGDGNVAHAHRAGLSWKDFFITQGILVEDKGVTFRDGASYLNNGTSAWSGWKNGKFVEDLWAQEIRDLDRVLFSYGSVLSDFRLSEDRLALESGLFLTSEACVQSGTCSHRGTSAPENCGDMPSSFWLDLLRLSR
ncbi:MAG: hypothetical protein G01um101418_471 [Parcubacteria group bacterium Gr01-1014_18]|nr:MAG: hypothetical protein Greene041636_517 [Parcubacteria group bacterium Greene0416_36]TSC81058.1 MAG: hypothetical protein G01um101418_471 [Parcubacteria group bacterium Gr01-1014_18]TSC98792.1 MAG: hypothetical protein Greene101420_542 [Parcubacteria group bacterium Greene1014_20]TSD06728.1 MAG: hypothetical protein Greene07142_649 [Parcubacteria group bacterium Greene0714_2]